ncbi:MAG: serine hydrolase [Eubacteriales bacterium]|nr:serine hydrolase [Eubacteriales bacterium]
MKQKKQVAREYCNSLEKVTPESAGIPSKAVTAFITRLKDKNLCLHSFIMIRHGKILAEGYYKPLSPDILHRMYSTSKSFLSVGVGILAGEGKISLDDRITQYFPDKTKGINIHPWLEQTTIRDMLRMADSHGGPTYNYDDPDFIATYFEKPPNHIPGKIFNYNTACTTTLTAMAERVAGMPLMDYLRPRLFDPTGFSKDAWCIKTPCGYSAFGTGVMCTSKDLARFALVCMNKGRWDGKQLIPEDYISAATSKQIDNSTASDDPEQSFGYGYQFWMTRHGGFACLGMGGQIAICLPDQDFILVTTADEQIYKSGHSIIYDALWDCIFPSLISGEGKLTPDKEAQTRLEERLKNLVMQLAGGIEGDSAAACLSEKAQNHTGIEYAMNDNNARISRVKFEFEAGEGRFIYTNRTGDHILKFGFGRHVQQEFPETHYFGRILGTPSGKGYNTYGSGVWIGDNDLLLNFFAADDYFGTLRVHVVFGENDITLYMRKVAQWFMNEYQGFMSGVRK